MALTQIITELISDSAVNTSKIANDAVDAAKLNVVGNGTTGQALLSDGDGTFSWGATETPNIVVNSISANTTAIKNNLYAFTADLTLTLPASPAAGDAVNISNMSGVTTCIVAGNGEKIVNSAQDLTIDVLNVGLGFVYVSSTIGWIIK